MKIDFATRASPGSVKRLRERNSKLLNSQLMARDSPLRAFIHESIEPDVEEVKHFAALRHSTRKWLSCRKCFRASVAVLRLPRPTR